MNISKAISYFLIFIGAIVAIYAEAQAEQNQYILIGGIVILMMGIYRVSRNIPSKQDAENNNEHDTDTKL